MICDKCGEEVEPRNNALLYDAALSALAGNRAVKVGTYHDEDGSKASVVYEVGYNPKVDAVSTDFNVFNAGELCTLTPGCT